MARKTVSMLAIFLFICLAPLWSAGPAMADSEGGVPSTFRFLSSPATLPPLVDLKGSGVGALTGTTNVNAAGFVVGEYSGEGTSTALGHFVWSAEHAVRWDFATPNGSGGLCASSSGDSTWTTNDGSEIFIRFTGPFCEAGGTTGTETTAHTPAPPFNFTGTFVVTGGTGRFASAAGGGSLIGSLMYVGSELKLLVTVDGELFP